jgi:hypothetical protein
MSTYITTDQTSGMHPLTDAELDKVNGGSAGDSIKSAADSVLRPDLVFGSLFGAVSQVIKAQGEAMTSIAHAL